MGDNEDLNGGFSDKFNLLSLGKGILAGYILIIPLFAVLSYCISLMKFPEKYITGAVIIANIISVIVAGTVSASAVKIKGWLNGAVTGLIYYLVLFLVSSMVLRNLHFGLTALTTMITCILGGSFGGMLGINYKKPSKYKYKHV